MTSDDETAAKAVFISYATANRAKALKACEAIERHGVRCWISCRDVPPGQNYQEAIVRALRDARAVVLIFSEAANTSDEIKKELSLASRYRVPVMTLRIEDVEPSDAFAYELSTRQWVDAFDGWEPAIEAVVCEIGQAAPVPQAELPAKEARRRASSRGVLVATTIFLLAVAVAAWWFLRPSPGPQHSMTVRLAGFTRLSGDLPSTMPAAMSDEITAAFANDGTIGVSTASSPAPGIAPAYALSGTIRRHGDQIKIIASLKNERTSANLWTESLDFDARQIDTVPRKVAVIAGSMVRCGLFAASTYPRAIPDPVMGDYLRYCHDSGLVANEPTRAMDFAHKVVAALPDFSMGWSAISNSAMLEGGTGATGPDAIARHAMGLQAADRALQLDPRNSEALGNKSQLINQSDLVGRERLLKQALAARPQSCGCEHFVYGILLKEVGRYSAAGEQLRRATELNPLDLELQQALAKVLLATGHPAEAQPHFDLARDLSTNPGTPNDLILESALATGDFQEALPVFRDPTFDMTSGQKTAFIAAVEALRSHDPVLKVKAVRLLTSTTDFGSNGDLASNLLGALGANREALKVISDASASQIWGARGWLFYPSLRSALSDPSFPALAEKLGLMRYWKATHTRPDVCAADAPPPFCKMI